MNSDFENSPCALYQDDGRMLLEDGMILKPRQTVACIISKNNYITASNHMKEKRIRDMFEDTMLYNPLKPVQFGRKLFFALSLKVRSNAHYSDFSVS